MPRSVPSSTDEGTRKADAVQGYCQVDAVEVNRCRTRRGRVHSGARDLLPGTERLGAEHSIVGGTQQMAPDSEQIADDAVDRKESLRVGGGFEPPHLPLPLARRLVGDFRPVVLVSGSAVKDLRHDGAVGGRIAAKLIGDESPWLGALTLQQGTQEGFCCAPVATGLKENIDHVAVLVDCTPKIVPATTDAYEQFVQVPGVTKTPLATFQVSGVLWPKLEAPLADGFVGDRDSPLGQEIFDIAEAQTEAVVEPHGVADDRRRESVSVICGHWAVHRPSLPGSASS